MPCALIVGSLDGRFDERREPQKAMKLKAKARRRHHVGRDPIGHGLLKPGFRSRQISRLCGGADDGRVGDHLGQHNFLCFLSLFF